MKRLKTIEMKVIMSLKNYYFPNQASSLDGEVKIKSGGQV